MQVQVVDGRIVPLNGYIECIFPVNRQTASIYDAMRAQLRSDFIPYQMSESEKSICTFVFELNECGSWKYDMSQTLSPQVLKLAFGENR